MGHLTVIEESVEAACRKAEQVKNIIKVLGDKQL
jgi:hypothetical protein